MAVNDHDWAVVISVSDYEGATAELPWRSALEDLRKVEPA
jgi:hypothetical protein